MTEKPFASGLAVGRSPRQESVRSKLPKNFRPLNSRVAGRAHPAQGICESTQLRRLQQQTPSRLSSAICQLLDIQPAGEAEAELPSETEQESLLVELERPWLACPHCQQAMHCIVATERPSWSVTMNSIHRPPWYQRF